MRTRSFSAGIKAYFSQFRGPDERRADRSFAAFLAMVKDGRQACPGTGLPQRHPGELG